MCISLDSIHTKHVLRFRCNTVFVTNQPNKELTRMAIKLIPFTSSFANNHCPRIDILKPLDGLRALASICVVFFHSFLYWARVNTIDGTVQVSFLLQTAFEKLP